MRFATVALLMACASDKADTADGPAPGTETAAGTDSTEPGDSADSEDRAPLDCSEEALA